MKKINHQIEKQDGMKQKEVAGKTAIARRIRNITNAVLLAIGTGAGVNTTGCINKSDLELIARGVREYDNITISGVDVQKEVNGDELIISCSKSCEVDLQTGLDHDVIILNPKDTLTLKRYGKGYRVKLLMRKYF